MSSLSNYNKLLLRQFTSHLYQEKEPRVKTLQKRLLHFYENISDSARRDTAQLNQRHWTPEKKATHFAEKYENSESHLRSELQQRYSRSSVKKLFLTHEQWKKHLQQRALLHHQQESANPAPPTENFDSSSRVEKDYSHESFEQQQTVKHSQPQLDSSQPEKRTSEVLAEQNFDQRKHEEELSAKQADIEYYQRLLSNKELEHKRLYNQLLQENERLHSEHERLRRENAQDLAESKRKSQEEIERVERKSQQDLKRTEQEHTKQLRDMGNDNSKAIQAQKAVYEEQIQQLNTSNKKLQTDNKTLSGKLARAIKESSARTQQLHEEEEKSNQYLHQRDDHAQLLDELHQERHQVTARLKEAARRRSESKSKEHSEKIIYLKLSKRAQSNMDILHRITEKIPLKCVHVETPEDVPDDAELFLFVNFLNTCRMTDTVQEEFKTFAGCGKKQDMIFLVALPRQKVINNEQFHRKFPQQLTSASLLPQVCFSGGELRTNPEATDAFQTLLDVVENSFPGSIRRKIEGGTSKDDVLMLLGDLGM